MHFSGVDAVFSRGHVFVGPRRIQAEADGETETEREGRDLEEERRAYTSMGCAPYVHGRRKIKTRVQ